MDSEDSNDIRDRTSAPLASSETFTDGATVENSKKKLEEKNAKSQFESLEKLLDFSSAPISNEIPSETGEITSLSTRIRFSEQEKLNRNGKVRLYFSFEIFLSEISFRTKENLRASKVRWFNNVRVSIRLETVNRRASPKRQPKTFFYFVSLFSLRRFYPDKHKEIWICSRKNKSFYGKTKKLRK